MEVAEDEVVVAVVVFDDDVDDDVDDDADDDDVDDDALSIDGIFAPSAFN